MSNTQKISINILLLFFVILIFASLKAFSNIGWQKDPTRILDELRKSTLSLVEFELLGKEKKTTDGCSSPRDEYNRVRLEDSKNLVLFDHCTVASDVYQFSEPLRILEVRSVGDLIARHEPGEVIIHNGAYHFDDGGQIVLEDEARSTKMMLQCAPEVRAEKIAYVFDVNRLYVSCAVLDVVGKQVGTLRLAAK